MPRIAGITTATPPHRVDQETVKHFARKFFGASHEFERLLPIYDNAQIDSRYFTEQPEWFAEPHTFTETNDKYIEWALELTEQVVCRLAAQCGLGTEEFDAIFFVSTTGLSTPSIDARLFNRMPLSRHIKRIPIWGLGCAAGAGGIARAFDYVRAYPRHRALVVSVELCDLAFHLGELDVKTIVASALFGDGAAACLVVGDEVELPRESSLSHPSILGSLSTIYKDSLDVMGWRITDQGLHVVLSRDIPDIVTSLVKENIEELCTAHGIALDQISHYVAHPGGTRVLQSYCEGLGIGETELRHSWNVLREFGNMSSATILFILKRFLEEVPNGSGEYGLLSALGPGFSSELVLVRWD